MTILGIPVDMVNISHVLGLVNRAVNISKKGFINVTGVHGIIESYRSEYVRKVHNSAFLCVPDGMPLVWIGRMKGFKEIDRCYGPDLMFAVFKESQKTGYKHFFYGGAEGVAEQLKDNLEARFPGVKIVGTFTPPFRPLNSSEERELIKKISKAKPDIIWVGLSTPKQEIFMYEYLPKIDTKLMIGVGAAFDFFTGRVKQAPYWMQRSGLEWFFRLMMEPKRLWKRYLINNPLFLFLITLQLLGIKKFSKNNNNNEEN